MSLSGAEAGEADGGAEHGEAWRSCSGVGTGCEGS